MRKLPTVRSKLVALVDMALLDVDVRGTRHKRAWAHLLGSDDDVAACVAEARALHDAGNLWDAVADLPDEVVAAVQESEAAEEHDAA